MREGRYVRTVSGWKVGVGIRAVPTGLAPTSCFSRHLRAALSRAAPAGLGRAKISFRVFPWRPGLRSFQSPFQNGGWSAPLGALRLLRGGSFENREAWGSLRCSSASVGQPAGAEAPLFHDSSLPKGMLRGGNRGSVGFFEETRRGGAEDEAADVGQIGHAASLRLRHLTGAEELGEEPESD